MKMSEKWVTIIYGDGAKARIPESKVQQAIQAARELKVMAKKPGSGYTEEEAEHIYSIRIVKADE